MRPITKFLLVLVAMALTMVACQREEDVFDETLLIGKWRSGTLYYRYDEEGKGVSWDEKDDIYEEEAQAFTWTLVKSELTHYEIMEMGGSSIPKEYQVTELTPTTLKYIDKLDSKPFSFTKVSDSR